jgi:hypothetical protein
MALTSQSSAIFGKVWVVEGGRVGFWQRVGFGWRVVVVVVVVVVGLHPLVMRDIG